MSGIFGKPLKRAIWNTLGLHAVLTTCLRFLPVLGDACVPCCLFLSTGSYPVRIQIHSTRCCFPGCTTKAFGAQKGSLWGFRVGEGDSAPAWHPGKEASYTPLSPMKKSPQRKATDNTRRASAIKVRFEKFLPGLPQADNRFSDANRPHTQIVHLTPVGGRRASPYNVWIHWLSE